MKKKALQVGITGGIGSGKTTVCKIFEKLGIPIYYADDAAKSLMIKDKKLISEIVKIFGEKAYSTDGSLNRKHIADLAFHKPQKLKSLNEAVHPAVQADTFQWQKKQKNVPYTLKEAALIFESGGYKYLDKIITVFAPEKMRVERVMLREDNLSQQDIEVRMSKQLPEEEKIKRADFIIYNDGSQSLEEQVLKIHNTLIEL